MTNNTTLPGESPTEAPSEIDVLVNNTRQVADQLRQTADLIEQMANLIVCLDADKRVLQQAFVDQAMHHSDQMLTKLGSERRVQ